MPWVSRRVALVALATLLGVTSGVVSTFAQAPTSAAKLPAKRPHVLLNHPKQGPTVCRVRAATSVEQLLHLPDGQYYIAKTGEAEPTERPFQFQDKKQLIEQLKLEFRGFNVKNTNRFVYVYNTSEKFYTGTSRILETMYPPLFDYFKRMKIEVHDPDTLLVIVMFANDTEFQEYRKMPEGVVAYYNMLDNRVTMYEHSKLSRVLPSIAMAEAISTVAHEGVHQILGNIGVQERLSPWPIWIGEGLAEYFAPTQVTSDVRWMGVGKVNELRLLSLNKVMQSASGELETVMRSVSGFKPTAGKNSKPENEVDKVIEALAGAEGLSATGYACTWGLTHYLAEQRRKEFNAFLVEASQLQPLTRLTTEERVALFKRHFGEDMEPLGKGMTDHVKKLNVRKR